MPTRPARRLKANVKPKSWPIRIKQRMNKISESISGKTVFRLSVYDLYGAPSNWQQKITRNWRVFFRETNFPYAIGLLFFCVMVIAVWRYFAPKLFYDLWVEFWGLTFDVIFVLIIFAFFEYRRQRAQRIQSQYEIVEDYKRWDNEEARFRLAGAIRRLNKLGVHAVDLSGARISDFSFAKHNIRRLDSSTFYDGTWGDPGGETSVVLKKVSFNHVDCSSVLFSPFDPFEGLDKYIGRRAQFVDCTFIEADLRGAQFNGASLKWSNAPPDSHYEFGMDEETGHAFSTQVSYGPFDQTDVTGASFVRSRFENADFRGAEGVLSADFSGATGIETAMFDDDETKRRVLEQVQTPPATKGA